MIAHRLMHFVACLLFAQLVFFGVACNTNKKATTVVEPADVPLTAEDYLKDIVQQQMRADWLDASAKLNYDDGSMAVGATASIKMEKDKVIWMSVKKFGFEIARAMITPDSLFILDRFNKEYAAEPISYIADKYNLPGDITTLQQILLGNPVFLTQSSPKAKAEDGQLRWSASTEQARNDFWFALPNYDLERVEVEQPTQQRSLTMELQNYQDAGGNRDFSYLRKIAVDSRETGRANIEIEFTKVELNVPTDIKFSVPSRYQKISN
ncbi:MAG: DUF4292 domain-containing protein [Bacteroidota bacterium]